MTVALLLGLMFWFIVVSSLASAKWRVEHWRRELQASYDCERAELAARCEADDAALSAGDLLHGLYGRFPPAPKFAPPAIEPPPPPVAVVERVPDGPRTDGSTPAAELRRKVLAKKVVRRQARWCACGTYTGPTFDLCAKCADAATLTASYSVPGHQCPPEINPGAFPLCPS